MSDSFMIVTAFFIELCKDLFPYNVVTHISINLEQKGCSDDLEGCLHESTSWKKKKKKKSTKSTAKFQLLKHPSMGHDYIFRAMSYNYHKT